MSSPDSLSVSLCSKKSSTEVQIASDVCWNRLRTVALAIRSTREKLEYHQHQLDEGGDLHHLVEAHQLAHEIQNLEITIARKHKTIEQLKRMCTKKRMILRKTDDELHEKKCQLDLKRRLSALEDHCTKTALSLKARRKYLVVFTQLARARRRVLLNEISEIFRIMVQMTRNTLEKQSCPCSTIDSMCNIHLPPVTELIGHQELEISAVLGYVAHLLDCISMLLDYQFRYPLQPGASASCIYYPKEKKSLPLYGSKWRAGRERIDQAVTLLGKNISQLREDSGFPSAQSERVLLSIHEWLNGILHSGIPIVHHHRPRTNLSSPAVLVDCQEKPVNEEILRAISQLEIQLGGHCNIETSSTATMNCNGGDNACNQKFLPCNEGVS
ncbi:hypothetical protein KIN20_018452 [Parelaphostrongylus tenuis]|uniref:Uncharacterized protein n=1 Tax=Parelaphostrongylus tenuis TaxID=148309 RepID=A0AAD5N7I5_PARTN|nr:hypothetical protein KIN20_018452 [Parelaphostrongylus tenuis]